MSVNPTINANPAVSPVTGAIRKASQVTGTNFGYLLATSGAVALFVYLAIASSQLVLGRRMRSEGELAPVRMWLFPYLTVVTIAAWLTVAMAGRWIGFS